MTMGKVWSVGDVLTAADLNAWAVPLTAIKASDTSRTSTTTIADDPDLVIAVAANASYRFWAYINYQGAATGSGDLKWSFSVPASATGRYQSLSVNTAGTLSPLLIGPTWTMASVNSAGTNGASNAMSLTMHGTLVVAGTAGSVTFRWAQNTSSGTSTSVLAQSAMSLDRIA